MAEEYRERIQRELQANVSMHSSNQELIAEELQNTPINTIKAYFKKQQEWRASKKTRKNFCVYTY